MMLKSGIDTVFVFGQRIAMRMSNIPREVVQSMSVREETFPAMNPAKKRPTSISNQYMAATAPPIVAALTTDSGFTHAPAEEVSER